METYSGTDMNICEIRQAFELQIKLGSISTDWQYGFK